ncbi:hypothetical protein [Nitratifractor sp.]
MPTIRQGEVGHSSVFLFDHYWWAPFLVIFVALLVSASTHRVEPYCFDGKVLRHDRTARITHWFNTAGILLLLYSGFTLGFLDFLRRVAFTEGRAGCSISISGGRCSFSSVPSTGWETCFCSPGGSKSTNPTKARPETRCCIISTWRGCR